MINKSWKLPNAAKQEIIQRDAAGNNSTWLACASAWNSLLSAVKLVLKWLYIGIEWPKDTKSDAFARRTVTASDSTCPADGVSLALMSTLLLILDSFCAGAKIIPDRASVHTWEQWFRNWTAFRVSARKLKAAYIYFYLRNVRIFTKKIHYQVVLDSKCSQLQLR